MRKFIVSAELIPFLKDGMTIMVGGFLANGSPEKLIDVVLEAGVKDLTVIANDGGWEDRGVGRLIVAGRVKRLVASHIGTNPAAGRMMSAGTLDVELVPQERLSNGSAPKAPVSAASLRPPASARSSRKAKPFSPSPAPIISRTAARSRSCPSRRRDRRPLRQSPLLRLDAQFQSDHGACGRPCGRRTVRNHPRTRSRVRDNTASARRFHLGGVTMEDKYIIAKRIAMELSDGDLVNLGIGTPTLVADFIPSDRTLRCSQKTA